MDVDSSKVGQMVGDLTIQHQDELVEVVAKHEISIGIITTSPVAAQEAANGLIEAGICSILNFSPTVG